MNKLEMRTASMADKKYAILSELFPNAVTETADENGAVVRAVDADILAREINAHVVSGNDERYQFTWPGKSRAIRIAGAPVEAALRPSREDSVSFYETENLYIEGDNLVVLKLLRETYLNRVKLIYIDPPYNTGGDFVYHDDFSRDSSGFLRIDGFYDDDGNRLRRNRDRNGRFHTDWLNMIYPRLKAARDLLADDGVIFISVDDNELENLKKSCIEIFGAGNFVADLIWANKEGGGSSDSKLFRIKHEHILCFAKSLDQVTIAGVPVGNEKRYKCSDEYSATRGKYYLQKMGMGTIRYSASLDYPITTPDGGTVTASDNNGGRKACWRWSKTKFERGLENGFIEMKKDGGGIWTVYSKQYLNCDNEGNVIARTQRPMGIIDGYSSTQAAKLLENLGLGSVFDYAKPVGLIRYLIERVAGPGDTVLDFFSGSATTAHAVMQLNAEDGGSRRFIMVQLPETCGENSEAAKKGFKNICEIGKERIRRAGARIKEIAGAQTIDTGFRVLRLDSGNMKDVYYSAEEYVQMSGDLDELIDTVKPGRTHEDLLFQVMLELGIPLSAKISRDGDVWYVDDGKLIACFDAADTALITEIAMQKPRYAVFRDRGFAGDSAMANCGRIFAAYSPGTIRKVL